MVLCTPVCNLLELGQFVILRAFPRGVLGGSSGEHSLKGARSARALRAQCKDSPYMAKIDWCNCFWRIILWQAGGGGFKSSWLTLHITGHGCILVGGTARWWATVEGALKMGGAGM